VKVLKCRSVKLCGLVTDDRFSDADALYADLS
jgi:hypothetical protein